MERIQESTKLFSVPIEKEVVKIDKDGNETFVTISYQIKFIDGARFMAISLSNLINNFTEQFHNCDYFLEYEIVIERSIKCKCTFCNKNYSNNLDKELKKRFKNIFWFPNNDFHEFILLLRKGDYPYEYMDEWERFDKTPLPGKKLYSNLNVEYITDADYMHAKIA